MKKILSLVLIVATLATLVVFAPTAGAETAYATVETTNAAGTPGSTVTVDVIVTAPTTNTVQLNFHYDRTRLELLKTPNPLDPNILLNATFPAGVTGNNVDNGDGLWDWNGDDPTKDKNGDGEPDGDAYALFENITATLGATDMSDGYKVATLTFKIKDDAPLGDAYVEFCDVGGAHTYLALQTVKHYGEEIAYKSSMVSVLPASYTAAPTPSPVEDFTFTDNGDGTASVKSYNGEDATVVIPSVDGDGNTVVSMLLGAFKANNDVETLWIPETVTSIATGAVGNCESLTAVYLLNANTELAEAAIGWFGDYKTDRTTRELTFEKDCIVYPADDFTVALTTVYCLDGTAKELIKNEIDNYDLVVKTADRPYILTVAGASYVVPANTTAPGQTVVDGKTVIAWKIGEEIVYPGADMTLTGDTTLEVALSVALPATTRDYSMKLSADTKELGMRFTSTLAKADYTAMAGLAGENGTVKLGMLITPNQYVERAGAFTKEALGALLNKEGTAALGENAYVDVAIGGYYEDDGTTYTLAASLVGFSDTTLEKNPAFAAVTYAEIDTDGDGNADITVYGQYDLSTVRTVKDVATKVHAEQATDTQKPWLEALLGKLPKED